FLLVEGHARGKGLGRRLVQRVVDHARSCGERRIILETASDLAAARSLYAAFGFRKVASVAGQAFLPRDVASERWELERTGGLPPPAAPGARPGGCGSSARGVVRTAGQSSWSLPLPSLPSWPLPSWPLPSSSVSAPSSSPPGRLSQSRSLEIPSP